MNIVEKLNQFRFEEFKHKIHNNKFYYLNIIAPVLHTKTEFLNNTITGCVITEVKLSNKNRVINKKAILPRGDLKDILLFAQGSGIYDGKTIKEELSKTDKIVYGYVVELPKQNKKVSFIGLCLEAMFLGVNKRGIR